MCRLTFQFLSIQVTQINTNNNSNLQSNYGLTERAKSALRIHFPLSLEGKQVPGSWTLEIHKTTTETIYKLYIYINMQPCQKTCLTFTTKSLKAMLHFWWEEIFQHNSKIWKDSPVITRINRHAEQGNLNAYKFCRQKMSQKMPLCHCLCNFSNQNYNN